MGLDDLANQVIAGAIRPEALLEWQHSQEGLNLLHEARTAGAFDQALERAVIEARGPTRRAVCETLLTRGFEHVVPNALSRCSREQLRTFEPDLRLRILGVEAAVGIEELLVRALAGPPAGARSPGPLVSAALLRIATEDDHARLRRLVEVLRGAPATPVVESLYRAFPSDLAFEARLAAGIAITSFDAVELRARAEQAGLLDEYALRLQLRSPHAGLRERALVLAMLHGGRSLADVAVQSARGLCAGRLADCALACRRAGPGRNYVAASVFFAFADPPRLARLIGTIGDRSFRETSEVSLWAAAERCRCPDVDRELRKEADAGQQDAMYALAHGRAEEFVEDLLGWAGVPYAGPDTGVLRPTALRLLAESRSAAGVCRLVHVILDAHGSMLLSASALQDHGLIDRELGEQLSRDSARRARGRAAGTDIPVGEASGLGLVRLLASHGGHHAEPLLLRLAQHPALTVATAAREALAGTTRAAEGGHPYR